MDKLIVGDVGNILTVNSNYRLELSEGGNTFWATQAESMTPGKTRLLDRIDGPAFDENWSKVDDSFRGTHSFIPDPVQPAVGKMITVSAKDSPNRTYDKKRNEFFGLNDGTKELKIKSITGGYAFEDSLVAASQDFARNGSVLGNILWQVSFDTTFDAAGNPTTIGVCKLNNVENPAQSQDFSSVSFPKPAMSWPVTDGTSAITAKKPPCATKDMQDVKNKGKSTP